MALGERIGDAYVRIHADGRGLDREVRDQWGDLDPVLRSLGNDHSDEYRRGWREGLKRHPIIDSDALSSGLSNATGNLDARMSRITEVMRERLREDLSGQFGERVGRRMFDKIEDGLQSGRLKGKTLAGLFPDPQEIDDAVADFEVALQEERLKILNDEELSQRKRAELIRNSELRINDIKRRALAYRAQLERDYNRRAEEGSDFLARLRADAIRSIESDETAHTAFLSRQQEIRKKAVIDTLGTEANMQRLVNEFRRRGTEDMRAQARVLSGIKEEFDRLRTGSQRAGESVEQTQRRLGEFTRTLGDLNNQDEDTQRLIRHMRLGLLGMSPALNRANRGWNDLSDTIGRLTGRGSRNNFLNFVGSVNRNISRMAGTVVFGFGRMLVGAKDFFQEIRKGGLDFADLKRLGVSSIQALAGGITTLVGAAAILGFIAASAGVLTAALSGLAAVLTALASSVLFAAAGALAPLVGLLGPLAAGVGAVVLGVKALKEDTSGLNKEGLEPLKKGFKDLREEIRKTFVEGINRNIGTFKTAFGSLSPLVSAGARGVVRAVEGIAQSFADPRFKVFSDTMSRFIPKALGSLGRSIGNLNLALAGIFRALIPITREFLGWLEKITAEFADWTNSRKGQRELKKFFEDAADSAKDVGDFLLQATKFLAQLIAQSKSTGDTLFKDMANALADVVKWLTSPEGKQAMQDWMDFAIDFGHALGDLVKGVINLIDALDTPETRQWVIGIIDAVTWLSNTIASIPNLPSVLFGGPVGGIISTVHSIGDAVKGVLNFLDIGGSKKPESFLGDIFNDLSPILNAKNAVNDLRDSLNQVTGAATQATRTMALQQLQADGLTTTANKLGISQRDLVSAALGNREALGRVTDAVIRADDNFGGLNSTYQNFLHQLGVTGAGIRRSRNDILLASQATQDFTGKLRGLPRNVKTLIRTEGIRPSVNGIAQVIRSARQLAPNLSRRDIKTIISASGVEPTRAALKRILGRVRDLDGAQARPTIDPNVVPFVKGVDKVNRDVRAADKLKAFPKADLEMSNFLRNNKALVRSVGDMNRLTPEPKARLGLEGFYQDRFTLIQSLNTIPDETVNVHINRIYSSSGGGGDGNEPAGTGEKGGSIGRTIAVPGITVVSNAEDPKAVAQELLNKITATAY